MTKAQAEAIADKALDFTNYCAICRAGGRGGICLDCHALTERIGKALIQAYKRGAKEARHEIKRRN